MKRQATWSPTAPAWCIAAGPTGTNSSPVIRNAPRPCTAETGRGGWRGSHHGPGLRWQESPLRPMHSRAAETSFHAGGGAVGLSLGRGRGVRTRRSTPDPAPPPRAVGRPQSWRTREGGKRAVRSRAQGSVSSGERCRARQRDPPGGVGRCGSCTAPLCSPLPRWRQP